MGPLFLLQGYEWCGGTERPQGRSRKPRSCGRIGDLAITTHTMRENTCISSTVLWLCSDKADLCTSFPGCEGPARDSRTDRGDGANGREGETPGSKG